MRVAFLFLIIGTAPQGLAAPIPAETEATAPATGGTEATASWYGSAYHGGRTANGEIYDMHALTAAHKELPFGTRVKVTNPANGRSVVVRINDRGPYIRGRDIDLSFAAARQIGLIEPGYGPVWVEPVRTFSERAANTASLPNLD